MATISLLILMGVTTAMLATMWQAQNQTRAQVEATQIALTRDLARQVIWQRVYNALTTTVAGATLPAYAPPTTHTNDWWVADALTPEATATMMAHGTPLTGLPDDLPVNHPARTALYWRETFATDDGMVVWRVTLWFSGDSRRPPRWQQEWWESPAVTP